MTARVVAFSLQLGAGGFEVAHGVAQTLKYQYFDSEITFRIATQVGASPEEVAASVERVPSFVQQMLERFAVAGGAVSDTYVAGPPPDSLTSALNTLGQDNYRTLIQELIKELAARGECVIVGHTAQLTLAHDPGVLKVLVYGSLDKRAERLSAELKVDRRRAQAMAEQSDKDRATFFDRVHHVDWLSPHLYDLCMSTDQVSPLLAAEMVAAAANGVEGIVPEPATPSSTPPPALAGS